MRVEDPPVLAQVARPDQPQRKGQRDGKDPRGHDQLATQIRFSREQPRKGHSQQQPQREVQQHVAHVED